MPTSSFLLVPHDDGPDLLRSGRCRKELTKAMITRVIRKLPGTTRADAARPARSEEDHQRSQDQGASEPWVSAGDEHPHGARVTDADWI